MSDCTLHQGCTDGFGYGMIMRKFDGVLYGRAHRYVWAQANGDPGKMCVLHHCDNPTCVNLEHLFLGTRTDNNKDMYEKGRNYHPPKLKQCQRGHDLTLSENRRGNGQCRLCYNAAWRRGYQDGRWTGGRR